MCFCVFMCMCGYMHVYICVCICVYTHISMSVSLSSYFLLHTLSRLYKIEQQQRECLLPHYFNVPNALKKIVTLKKKMTAYHHQT